MKSISINLVKFAILLGISTILFRFVLSKMLEDEQFNNVVWLIAALYGVIILIIGWVFGKKDKESLPLYDIGFRFHLTTYLICNTIGELWYLFGFQSKHENVKTIHLTVLFWGLGVLLHYILYVFTRKNSIKGLKKSEIFD